MKPIKNLRGFITSLYRSNLFGKISVVDGVVVAHLCGEYRDICDILLHEYLHTHRVAYLSTSPADENIVITVKFY